MYQGLSICLTGASVAETAQALGKRLVEQGKGVEEFDGKHVEHLGGPVIAAYVCKLLSRNGVIVLVTSPDLQPEGETLDAAVDPNDTPDFAAEKILETLSEKGLLSPGDESYTAEEEEEIRKRLSDLGYIE